jgi:hypothetical protein
MAQEWSKGRRTQLRKITVRLLKGKPKPGVVNLITAIEAYERLVMEQPDQRHYWLKLRDNIDRLATLLVASGKTGQASRLKSLGPFLNVSEVEVRRAPHKNPDKATNEESL